MKTKVLMSVAGLAACGAADAQVRPELQTAEFSGRYVKAVRATEIVGKTIDGQYVYGKTVELGEGNSNRLPGTRAYDAAQMSDTDGDGLELDPICADLAPHGLTGPSNRYWFGLAFSWQSYAEDIIPVAGTEGQVITSFATAGANPLCDGGAGTVSEQLTIVLESWEGFDNFPDLDGGDGEFGGTPDGLGFPASLSDTDGDTFVDEFIAGVLLDYGIQPSAGALGYGIFFATGLDTLGVALTSNQDLWDGGKPGTDGRPDGGIRVIWTRGDGGDGLGPIGGLYPATRAQSMLWGTYSMQNGPGACADPDTNFGGGQSDPTIWGEGENLCPPPRDVDGSWSGGAPSGNEQVDDVYDTTFDIADWTGIVPDFAAPGGLGLMVVLNVGGGPATYDCCDVNNDGTCNPADFSAWIAAFNAQLPRCDTNDDGLCNPADFSGWIAAFNASTGGNPLQCVE